MVAVCLNDFQINEYLSLVRFAKSIGSTWLIMAFLQTPLHTSIIYIKVQKVYKKCKEFKRVVTCSIVPSYSEVVVCDGLKYKPILSLTDYCRLSYSNMIKIKN